MLPLEHIHPKTCEVSKVENEEHMQLLKCDDAYIQQHHFARVWLHKYVDAKCHIH